MSAFKFGYIFFVVLLVLASAIDHPHSYSAADHEVDENGGQNQQFPTFHIHIVNQLSNKKTLYLHCKSQEEGDKGIQNLKKTTTRFPFQGEALRIQTFSIVTQGKTMFLLNFMLFGMMKLCLVLA
ncbi:hypothetical protein CRYUN_Cryun04dG0027700 [Craigia yunnanensis]